MFFFELGNKCDHFLILLCLRQCYIHKQNVNIPHPTYSPFLHRTPPKNIEAILRRNYQNIVIIITQPIPKHRHLAPMWPQKISSWDFCANKKLQSKPQKYRHCCPRSKTIMQGHLNKYRHQTSAQKTKVPQRTSRTSTPFFLVLSKKHRQHASPPSQKIHSNLDMPSPISLFVWILIEHVDQFRFQPSWDEVWGN